jgi:hypothetical protein
LVVRVKTLKSLDTKEARSFFSETATRFQVKFFERFGKLFFKKVFQGLLLPLDFPLNRFSRRKIKSQKALSKIYFTIGVSKETLCVSVKGRAFWERSRVFAAE